MRNLKLLIFGIVISQISYTQTFTASANTNGIGLIPSFSLGKPAGLLFMSTNITKNLELAPDFAFDLKEGNAWFFDLWLKWNQPLDSLNKWVATVGVDWSLFFKEYMGRNETVTRTLRYPTLQGKLKFTQSVKNTFILEYWYSSVVEKNDGIIGHYLSFIYSRSLPLKKFSLKGNLNTFYLNYSDGTKGFGTSFDARVKHEKSGLFLGFQISQPLTLTGDFNKNFFLGITRKLF